jgi:FAD/FMN-containing dehydrogenase
VVLDSTKAAQIWLRAGMEIITNCYGTAQFENNLWALRGEMRLGLGIPYPAAICIVTGLLATDAVESHHDSSAVLVHPSSWLTSMTCDGSRLNRQPSRQGSGQAAAWWCVKGLAGHAGDFLAFTPARPVQRITAPGTGIRRNNHE